MMRIRKPRLRNSVLFCRQIATLAAIVGAASAASAAVAAEADALKAKVDVLAQPLLDRGLTVGLVVGVIDAGHRQVFGYGRISASDRRPPDGDTLFEIGSVTKVFTGLLLATMVADLISDACIAWRFD